MFIINLYVCETSEVLHLWCLDSLGSRRCMWWLLYKAELFAILRSARKSSDPYCFEAIAGFSANASDSFVSFVGRLYVESSTPC